MRIVHRVVGMRQTAWTGQQIALLVVADLICGVDPPSDPLVTPIFVVPGDVELRRIEADDVDRRSEHLVPLHVSASVHPARHWETLEDRLPQAHKIEPDAPKCRFVEEQDDLFGLQFVEQRVDVVIDPRDGIGLVVAALDERYRTDALHLNHVKAVLLERFETAQSARIFDLLGHRVSTRRQFRQKRDIVCQAVRNRLVHVSER